MRTALFSAMAAAGLLFLAASAEAGCRHRHYYYETVTVAPAAPAASTPSTASMPGRSSYSSAYNAPAASTPSPDVVVSPTITPVRSSSGSITQRMERGRQSIKSMTH